MELMKGVTDRGVVLHVEVGEEGPPPSGARLVKLSSSHSTPRWAVPLAWSLPVLC